MVQEEGSMFSSLKSAVLCGAIALGVIAPQVAQALPIESGWNYFYDRYNDAQPGTLGASSQPFEAYYGGYKIENGNLYLQIVTGFNPNNTVQGLDTYSAPNTTTLSVADLRINTTKGIYGLALSSHSGQITADPNEAALAWRAVNKGNLYSSALFSTGTYESYIASDAPCTSSNGLINRCSTLIADYGSNLGSQNLTFSLLNGGASSQVNPDGTMRAGLWSINAVISLASLGLSGADTFDIMWAVAECGNDFFQFRGQVPEPATIGLLSAGLLGLGARRRRKLSAAVA